VCYSFTYQGGDPPDRGNVKEGVIMSGALRGVPRRVGSGIKTGEAGFYGAREGEALPPRIVFKFNA